MGSSEDMLIEFEEVMMKTFEMYDLGPMRYFLGLEMKQSMGSIFVSQSKYAENLLHKAGILNCITVTNPMNSNEKLHSHDNSGEEKALRYRKLVGGLLYLTHKHPDIMHAVSVVSRFMESPSKHHFGAIKRILH